MSTDTREILERRLGLALDFQGLLAAELKQMRAWRNKWRTRTREFRDRAAVAEAVVRSLRSELATATASLGSAQAVANLQAEVTDLRRQKTDLETALGAAVTAWNKDKAALDAVAAGLRTQLDAATKRAELAETTLESVRAAVAKPVEDKQDTRPKVGDAVPWSEMEDGALYFDTPCMVPFVGRYRGCWHWLSNDTGSNCVANLLAGFGSANPRPSLVHSNEGTLIARDLGSDPEAWRAAMREHLAKVGA